MSVASFFRALTLAWLAGWATGCSLKSSQPAGDITLAQPVKAIPVSRQQSQGLPNESGIDSTSASQSSQPPSLTTDSGADIHIRSGEWVTEAPQPSSAQSSQTISSPIAYKPVVSEHRAKHCKGNDCPKLKIKQVEFVGQAKFNYFLDQALATMAGVDQDFVPPYRNLKELTTYFMQTARPRQTIDLQSEVVRATAELIVVRLDSYLYNGGANGLSATQYVNWVFRTDRLLSLESMLLPGAMPKYLVALKTQHAKWLATNPVRQDHPAKYDQVWPFVPSDNVALMADGLAVQYDPYAIAPGSFGRPVITIPYDALQDILRPEVMLLGRAPSFKRNSR